MNNAKGTVVKIPIGHTWGFNQKTCEPVDAPVNRFLARRADGQNRLCNTLKQAKKFIASLSLKEV
jgi:hypothetical protein